MNKQLVFDFTSWVDRLMGEHPTSPAVAYNFNLYEHEDEFAIQLIGATSVFIAPQGSIMRYTRRLAIFSVS